MPEYRAGITVTGVEEVAKNLQRVSKELKRDAFWELFRFCNDEVIPNVQRYASQGAPETPETKPHPLGFTVPVTGWLAGSIGITSGEEEYGKRSISIISSAKYSYAQEFGWLMTIDQAIALAIKSKKAGIFVPRINEEFKPHLVQHPFLRPGVYGKAGEMVKILQKFIDQKLG